MEFYAPNKLTRPVRLSEETRRFAYESLNCKYGLEALEYSGVLLDDNFSDIDSLTFLQRYNYAIKRIAAQAPIRICEGEKISGSANLGLAIRHAVPAIYQGNALCSSISHVTLDFETVLKKGVNDIKRQAQAAYEAYKGSEKEAFLDSCLICLSAFEDWHARYVEALSVLPEYKSNYENLLRVPFEPARNFYEAVQSLWFAFAFVRLCGNWPGIGRLDYLLGDYLKADLANATITLDEAREILAHFFIKGCEWITGKPDTPFYGSGDAQHYQNIVLSGTDEKGNDVTNEVTYLVLDIIEEFGISEFPTTLRLNAKSDEKLLSRIAEVMRHGGGILAVYNEDTVLSALVRDGYSPSEAWKFANDGCWEVQIPGKTYFTYMPFDSLQILQKKTLSSYDASVHFESYEALYQAYIKDLSHSLADIYKSKRDLLEEDDPYKWKKRPPCTVPSLFENGCIEKGLSYLEGGPIYNITSPHIGGLADTVNSLYAIKALVFDQKKVSFAEMMQILRENWEGDEVLRRYALNRLSYYGNDNDEVDAIATRLLKDFSALCKQLDGTCGYRFPAGVSTFGRQLEWSKHRLACPHGRRAGEVLAANCSPTPGSDTEGATAIVRSYCKNDLAGLATGAALDIKLLPSSVVGKDGIDALVALMRGFVTLGGFFMQPDVVDAAILRKAQECPEEYSNLSVRVSGWNARFVTLNKEWQDMVIQQNEH